MGKSGTMKWAFFVFTAHYGLALCLLAAGTFGWFGQSQGPLAGELLIPPSLPWNIMIDRIGGPRIFAGAIAPAINAAVLFFLWKR
jgi:hypothetical protein